FISFHLYISVLTLFLSLLFFFTDPPPTEIYTLSLHDALPIYLGSPASGYRLTISTSPVRGPEVIFLKTNPLVLGISRSVRFSEGDRKSTRLNSSHVSISYAVFCLKKKKLRYKRKKQANNKIHF